MISVSEKWNFLSGILLSLLVPCLGKKSCTKCESVPLPENVLYLFQDPKGNRETAKEEESSKSSSDSTATKTEEEKKIKAPKKQKLVHEITMELDVNDVPDLLEDELKSSMKKYV